MPGSAAAGAVVALVSWSFSRAPVTCESIKNSEWRAAGDVYIAATVSQFKLCRRPASGIPATAVCSHPRHLERVLFHASVGNIAVPLARARVLLLRMTTAIEFPAPRRESCVSTAVPFATTHALLLPASDAPGTLPQGR